MVSLIIYFIHIPIEPKNWYFWTMELEKTLESPLESKEIKPVNPNGNQPWIFLRTDAETEAPILWPPDAKNWLISEKKESKSLSVMSNSLWPHGLQHTRLPCPSPTPGVCSNSCPLSWWCHPTILSPVVPFSFCLQSFPATRSFLISQFLASGGQSIGASAQHQFFQWIFRIDFL